MDTEGQVVFTTDQVAWIMEVTRRTVQRWSVAEKIAKPWRTPGDRPYYTMEHVRAMLPHLDPGAVKRLVDDRMASYVAPTGEDDATDTSDSAE